MKRIAIFLFSLPFLGCIYAEENLCTINGKKALNKVSDKFLSITINPASLLTGEVALSDRTILLAKHFSPAFVRLAGPSTPLISYSDSASFKGDGAPFVLTPSIWYGANEWLRQTGLVPIFGLADGNGEGWDPKDVRPLLEITDRLNVSCYWQLGYDCSNKTETGYKKDLKALRVALDSFPDKKLTWKVVGSDMSKCFPKVEKLDKLRQYTDDIENDVEAVMWEKSTGLEEKLKSFNRHTDSAVSLWTSLPKEKEPIVFSSLFSWIKNLEESAILGFNVVFTEPAITEFSSGSPMYWFALLHKKLMGKNVLDVKCSNLHSKNSIYAHCTKNQDQFVRRGAVTVLAINDDSKINTLNVKLGLATSTEKTMEIQSYILTASAQDSTKLLLNDELLTLDLLDAPVLFKPKLRRAKVLGHIILEVPANSIAFFVLADARASICDKNEETAEEILEEIANISPRGEEKITNKKEQENKKIKRAINTILLEERYLLHRNKQHSQELMQNFKIDDNNNKNIQYIRTKRSAAIRNSRGINNNLLGIKSKIEDAKNNWTLKQEEVKERLKERFLKASKINRHRRDINIDLLKKKTEGFKTKKKPKEEPTTENSKLKTLYKHKEQKMATIRKPGQTSEELLAELASSEEEDSPQLPSEVFAELLTEEKSDEGLSFEAIIDSNSKSKKTKASLKGIIVQPESTKAKKKKKKSDYDLQFLFGSQEVGDIEDDLPSIHEYYGYDKSTTEKPRKFKELWEVGLYKKSKKNSNGHKDTKTRDGFSSDELDIVDDDDNRRKKRDTRPLTKEDYRKYKKYMKERLRVLKQQVIKAERKMLKSEEIPFEKEQSDDFEEPVEIKKERIRQLQALKAKLKANKHNIQKWAKEDLRLNNLLDEYQKEIEKPQPTQLFLAQIIKNDDNKHIDHIPPKKTKRSIFDKDIFGNYKYSTPSLKLRKPSDSFLTKTKIDLPYRKSAATDYEKLLNDMIRQNKFVTYRKKRRISSASSMENEVEDPDKANKIIKGVKFIKPKLDFEKGDYELVLPNKDKFELKNDKGNTRFQYIHPKIELGDAVSSSSKIESDSTTVKSVAALNSRWNEKAKNNVQKITKKVVESEPKILESLVKNIESFFDKFGRHVKSYFNRIWD